jgi:serine/threonine protein kinase
MALQAGTRLGPYEVLSLTGAGGMGEVWKARDTRLDRTVAIKVLASDLTSDPAARERFEREARAVAALSHPHICALFDIGHQDGSDYLVMEFLDGETLAHRLSRGKLPLEQCLKYGIQIADGLAAAHQAGIVHRDLKPGNIMLTKSGAKLLDFGLAKPAVPMVGSQSTQFVTHEPPTGAGTLVGTLQYMAPEQLQGFPADARSDVFAFGCVLYEMVAGRPAFARATPASLIAAILEHEPAPMAVGSEPIAFPVLDAIVGTCLAKNPADRWSSGHDVWVALRRFGHVGEPPKAAGVSRSEWGSAAVAWGIATLLLVTTIVALYRPDRPPSETSAAPAVRAFIDFPSMWLGGPILSPDARYLAMTALQGGPDGRTVLIRRLADGEVTWLERTEQAVLLGWSPDSRSFAIIADGALKAVDVATGGIRTIGKSRP